MQVILKLSGFVWTKAITTDLHILPNGLCIICPPPPSPLRQVIEIREFNSTFEVHLLFLLPRHICTAAEESKNKEGSAVAANDWRAIIVVGGGGKGGLLSGKNLAGQEAKQHESQNSPSVCGLLRNDQMRHQ